MVKWKRRPEAPFVIVVFSVLLISLFLIPSSGSTLGDTLSEKQEQAKRIKEQLQANQNELNRLTVALNQTQAQIASLQASIEKNQRELQVAEAELKRLQQILSNRIVAMYKEGNSTSLEVILECSSFDEFLNSYDYMRLIGEYDANMVSNARGLVSNIKAKRNSLEEAKANYKAQLSSLASQRSAVQAKLAEQQRIINSLNSEIASMVQQQLRASGGGGGGGYWNVGPVDGLYFPVAGPHSFCNDWGAPRSGGRTHKGCDIMANYGTPCVAITSGTVERRAGGNAGLYIFLHGDNGHLYYYMHLQGYAAGGHVAGGTVIGYVGDTGNARGCPHLHFEFHPNHGPAVNPYPLLKAIDR